MAAPITYEVDGEQYIAVLAGWGGAYPLDCRARIGQVRQHAQHQPCARVQARGKVRLPPVRPVWQHTPPPPPDTADAATLNTGLALFARFCCLCHGNAAVGGGVVPDLRKSLRSCRGRFLQHRSRRRPEE